MKIPNPNVEVDAPPELTESQYQMGDSLLYLLKTAKGADWAKEFRLMAIKLGYSDMDEGWLIGWFSNACQAAWDIGYQRGMQGCVEEVIDA